MLAEDLLLEATSSSEALTVKGEVAPREQSKEGQSKEGKSKEGKSKEGQSKEGQSKEAITSVPLATKVLPKYLLPPKKQLQKQGGTAQISQQTRVRYEVLQDMMREARWVNDRAYFSRQTTAWLFVFLLIFVCAIGSMAYSVQFGDKETHGMLISWLMSVSLCILLIEPVQIVFVTLIPLCINPDSRLGQFIEYIRWLYNEYFTP